jgi:NADH-quinone oxidoreductase subunit H
LNLSPFWFDALAGLAKIAFVWGVVLAALMPILVWIERRGAALIQDRPGPDRVGPFGLLQSLADVIKFFAKEDIVPTYADKLLYTLAPWLLLVPAITTFAVIPFGATLPAFGHMIPLVIADVNIGILYVFALTSIGVYGIVLAGWASNSKYSLLGGLRSAAQMISYELSYGMALAAVIMLAGSLSLREIVMNQSGYWWGFIPKWYVFLQPVGFFIFMTAGIAETNRAPFDFPEAEQELVAGYHTEYSSMSFALFFLAEYVNMVTVSAVATNLYLGGWHGPILPPWLGVIWWFAKLSVLLFFYLWLRWTLPRYRYDQLMQFGWKFLLPLSVVNLLVTAAGVLYFGL